MADSDDREDEAAPARPRLPVRLARYTSRWTRPQRTWVQDRTRDVRLRSWRHADYDRSRDLTSQTTWAACYAPSTSMYLDQFGKVRACCQNTGHLLGDVTRQSLREIWDGAATGELRSALAVGDFGRGCEFCAWQVSEAGPEGAFAHGYDRLVAARRPRWPRQLEFAVTNTCNLQCVMCNGDWSSSIRAQREGRPALAAAYGEAFFEELRSFVPHLEEAKFTGGEPFLGREPLRILGLLAELGAPNLKVTVTTNGTVFNERVAELVASLHITPVVSIDGGTREVYERIRVGASFDRVIANLDRLLEITRARERNVTIAHCLMVDNWETFPELLLLAEARDLYVGVNTVRFPERHSLYHLAPPELDHVTATLEARTPDLERRLTGQRLTMWHRQIAALRARRESNEWPEALGQFHQADDGPRPVPVELRRGPAGDG